GERAALIIAADGGLAALSSTGVAPTLLVGDFDSVDPALVGEFQKRGVEILRAQAEKNETDTQLALYEAVRRGAKTVCLLGATGSRTDHFLSALMLLVWSLKNGVELVIEDGVQTIEIGCGDFAVYGKKGQTVSIIPAGSFAEVTAEGLYYPLEKLLLTNGLPRGVSNVFLGEEAAIHTKEPVFVIKIK
ncbi:MAG TPA: thiamine diphosphokinase, partial [Clostridiales bacterium]|nr:thiamine diphosphokinase [Clostridiales bacterium]